MADSTPTGQRNHSAGYSAWFFGVARAGGFHSARKRPIPGSEVEVSAPPSAVRVPHRPVFARTCRGDKSREPVVFRLIVRCDDLLESGSADCSRCLNGFVSSDIITALDYRGVLFYKQAEPVQACGDQASSLNNSPAVLCCAGRSGGYLDESPLYRSTVDCCNL